MFERPEPLELLLLREPELPELLEPEDPLPRVEDEPPEPRDSERGDALGRDSLRG